MSATLKPECREILAGISDYLDGELDDAACQSIERHCQTCVSCADLVNGLRVTVGLCRQAASVPIPDAVRDRAKAAVRQLLESPPRS